MVFPLKSKGMTSRWPFVVHDSSCNPKYMDELYHQYKSLSNVYKGYIARTAWDGVNYKEEWLRKSQIIPEKYSEVEVLKVTDYLRHRDFLKRA